jgi:hypothetical protein
MRLRFVNRDNTELILAWWTHPVGAELLLQGKGFVAPGFSLGIYSLTQLAAVRLHFARQEPERVDPLGRQYFAPCYTFTKPAKFAPLQGHETRLAIHAEGWRYDPKGWIIPRGERTVTIHEQGERTPWRWLGRYEMGGLVVFLREGMDVCKRQEAPSAHPKRPDSSPRISSILG